MAYFDNAKVGDKVYGLVFGKGKIIEVFSESFYSILVEFKNGYEVPYTEDGVPGWGNFRAPLIIGNTHNGLCKCKMLQETFKS